MRCRCGNEIKNVPEHLQDLAKWVCQQCTNATPRSRPVTLEELDVSESIRKRLTHGRKKEAA